jgi:transcriptional regulator with XRE-family HTH domain
VTSNLDVYIGSRILEKRAEVGLSPEQLAQMIGCSSQEMAEIEVGHHRASAQFLADLASVLGVDIGFFFEGIASVVLQRSPLSQTNSETVIPFCKKPMRSFDHD